MIEQNLKQLVEEKKQANMPDFLIVNFLKEYLQYPVLDFLYKNKKYRNFIFTGGSCLRICHNLPRLSEDLDFDLNTEEYEIVNLQTLGDDLKNYFQKEFFLNIEIKVQERKRIYLKFPILRQLGVGFGGGIDFLYVKIEPSQMKYKQMQTDIQAISQFGYNFILKKYSLEAMMTGKIIAVFTREWFKGAENEIDIKGRDFYDLFWFFQKKVEPDYEVLQNELRIKDERELKIELKKRIEKGVTAQKLKRDLINFLPDQKFTQDFCENYKKIINPYLEIN